MDWKKWYRNFMANRRRSQRRPISELRLLHGGPFDQQQIRMSGAVKQTLTFNVNQWHGYYEESSPYNMVWINK